MRPSSDSDVDVACSYVSHFLGLDLISLSTNQEDAFYVALAVLASTFKVPQSKFSFKRL